MYKKKEKTFGVKIFFQENYNNFQRKKQGRNGEKNMIRKENTYDRLEVYIDDDSLLVLEEFIYDYLVNEKDIELNKYYHLRKIYENIVSEIERKGGITTRSKNGTIDNARKSNLGG